MNLNFWKNKNILITGHTGFKGAWLSILLNYLGANVYGVSDVKKEGIYKVVEKSNILKKEFFIDINSLDESSANKLFKETEPDIVFHIAAQSLVYECYIDPLNTLSTNIIGTFNVMKYTDELSNALILTIATTDKVYLNPSIQNVESDPLGGKDFYSASKASSEFAIQAFLNNKSRDNLNITVIRSGNVIGGGDRAKFRLLTDLVNSINTNTNFELRKPDSIRPWQFILDSLWGYLMATEENYNKKISNIYNLNSKINNKYTAKSLIETYLKFWGGDQPEVVVTDEKFKEVNVLTIDSTKAKNELGWEPIYEFEESIREIVEWEKDFLTNKTLDICTKQIKKYVDLRTE